MHVGRWAGVLRRGAHVGDERVFLRRRVHVARRDANGGRGVVRELVLDRANDGRERFAVRARGGESTTGGFVAAVAVVVAVEARRRRANSTSGPDAPTNVYAIRTGANEVVVGWTASASSDVVAYAIDGCDASNLATCASPANQRLVGERLTSSRA